MQKVISAKKIENSLKLKEVLRPHWHLLKYIASKLLCVLPTSSEKIGSPRKTYKLTHDWIKQLEQGRINLQDSCEEIYPSHQVCLSKPRTIRNCGSLKFYTSPTEYIDGEAENILQELPPAFVAVIPAGRVWGYNGSVITPDDGLLVDVSTEFPNNQNKFATGQGKHPIFRQLKLPSVLEIEGTVAVLSVASGGVYYHWMFDLLPRIGLLHSSKIQMNSIDKFVVNEISSRFQRETLSILGIPEEKIVESKKTFPIHIKANKLIVPSLPRLPGGCMPKWACDFLRQEILSQKISEKQGKYERIYITRANATHRKVLNEIELVELLTNRFGFKSVALESLSVVEQALLFASARVVVAPHGAGLSNIVFCRPGTKVIEFFSPKYLHPVYWRLSNQVDLEYYCFLGQSQPFYEYKDPKTNDILVNLDSLLEIASLAGI